ncbi:hypothetical protein F4679DRAFT_582620 [Xylaria curta]|nr:hypothetical protein F4679DRAFT_582620 [Xylaria curta]
MGFWKCSGEHPRTREEESGHIPRLERGTGLGYGLTKGSSAVHDPLIVDPEAYIIKWRRIETRTHGLRKAPRDVLEALKTDTDDPSMYAFRLFVTMETGDPAVVSKANAGWKRDAQRRRGHTRKFIELEL